MAANKIPPMNIRGRLSHAKIIPLQGMTDDKAINLIWERLQERAVALEPQSHDDHTVVFSGASEAIARKAARFEHWTTPDTRLHVRARSTYFGDKNDGILISVLYREYNLIFHDYLCRAVVDHLAPASVKFERLPSCLYRRAIDEWLTSSILACNRWALELECGSIASWDQLRAVRDLRYTMNPHHHPVMLIFVDYASFNVVIEYKDPKELAARRVQLTYPGTELSADIDWLHWTAEGDMPLNFTLEGENVVLSKMTLVRCVMWAYRGLGDPEVIKCLEDSRDPKVIKPMEN